MYLAAPTGRSKAALLAVPMVVLSVAQKVALSAAQRAETLANCSAAHWVVLMGSSLAAQRAAKMEPRKVAWLVETSAARSAEWMVAWMAALKAGTWVA